MLCNLGAINRISSSSFNSDTCTSAMTADIPVTPYQYQPSMELSMSSSLIGVDATTVVSGSHGTSLKFSFKCFYLKFCGMLKSSAFGSLLTTASLDNQWSK